MPASQHQSPKSDIEIAQAAKKRPIMEIAREKLEPGSMPKIDQGVVDTLVNDSGLKYLSTDLWP